MNKITPIRPSSSLVSGGEPPHDGSMEVRVAKLEAIIPTLATKADMSDLRADISKDVGDLRADIHKISGETKGWFIATAVLVLVGMFTIANVMMSNLRASAPQMAHQPAPIIIQVPAPATSATQAPTQSGEPAQFDLPKTPPKQ